MPDGIWCSRDAMEYDNKAKAGRSDRWNGPLWLCFDLYAFAFWGQIYRLLKSFGLYCFVVYFRSTISPMSLTPGRISRFMSCRTLTCSESP